ncbi:SMP-30/gluconolactonase/LRE family protein [Frankia sp. AiPa1]|uniref:SMP-30/gluconolactonase/LRE family protein n=1 Tax=Frankia sp. AiPa1 TaxID=573492 RepID=UPI0035A9060B
MTPRPLAQGFVFVEGPRWHAGQLWFSDMHGEAVHRATLAGETTRVAVLSGRKPSGLGFLPDGTPLVVSMAERTILRLAADGSFTVHADLSGLVDDELNDMVVDATGTGFVGSYPTEPDAGVIVRVRPDGSAAVVADGMDFPNGSAISPDGRTLIVAESKGRRLTAFDLDGQGVLSGRRVLADRLGAAPDGIALDAEGAVWAAFPLAHEFRRILPGGEVTDVIDTGERMAIACALGGEDRRTLFLCAALDWNSSTLGGRRTSVVLTRQVPVAGAGRP